MNPLDLDEVRQYVSENIDDFHRRRIASLEVLKLRKLLEKNPYLFKAKYVVTAPDLIVGWLDAFLSSSEEKLFGDFLEGLAIFVAQITCNGHKSSTTGIDLEFYHREIHYLVSVKSGPHWGNSSQYNKLVDNFKEAVKKLKQSRHEAYVQPVLGICYGKARTSNTGIYLKVYGQNFWTLISENRNLYTDIIEPIGYRAQEMNETFVAEKGKAVNRLTKEFLDQLCDASGAIDWVKLVEFNSGNFDLNRHGFFDYQPQ